MTTDLSAFACNAIDVINRRIKDLPDQRAFLCGIMDTVYADSGGLSEYVFIDENGNQRSEMITRIDETDSGYYLRKYLPPYGRKESI